MKKIYIHLTLCGFIVILLSCGSNDAKENQTLKFNYLAPHNISEGSFSLKATASSGLPVTFFSSDASIATIKDSTLILHKTGSVEITAVQMGNDKYFEAARVVRNLGINEDGNDGKLNQTIAFVLTETVWKLSSGNLILKAVASSNLPVTLTSSDIAIASINGNVLTVVSGINGADILITASQGGNDDYNAAPTVSHVLEVIHDVGCYTLK
jgi:hypothetical protein